MIGKIRALEAITRNSKDNAVYLSDKPQYPQDYEHDKQLYLFRQLQQLFHRDMVVVLHILNNTWGDIYDA